MDITVKEQDLIAAANEGMDAFIDVFVSAIKDNIGGELNADNMGQLNADQITLLAYMMFRDEVMDGGFVQLIHNGYGPFIFENPFAKALRGWGAKQLTNLIYSGRKLYELHKEEITKECDDDEFMAMFERYPEFDELDDAFVEMEEEVTALIAQYIDNNIEQFANVEK